jgi:TatA/E family protein of Tat protein translocase
MPFGLQPLHLFLIVVIALLVFGSPRLPEISRHLGKTLGEIRHWRRAISRDSSHEYIDPVSKSEAGKPDRNVSKSYPHRSPNVCSFCGTHNTPTARYCHRCGISL